MPTCERDPKGTTMSAAGRPSKLLRYYAALESASHEMLQAARAGDWDSVCHLEGACAVMIAKVRQLAREQPLPPQEQRERMRILRSILADDAEIRRICNPLPFMLDRRDFPWHVASNTVH